MNVSALHIPIENIFSLLCCHANMGCRVFDFQNNRHWWSDTYQKMLGIENNNHVQSLEDFLDHTVHPADRYQVTSSIKKYLYNHIASDTYEVRLKHCKGHYNWYKIFNEARYNEQNKIQDLISCILNIDDKKRQEEESQRLKFVVDVTEEMMGIGVYERNFETGERVWSKMVYDVFELPYDTYLTGNEVVQYFIEKDRAKIVKATDELRYKKKPYDLEMQLITAKGNKIWVRITAKPLVNSYDNVTGYRGMFQRIEKQKLKENFLIDIRNKIAEQNFFLDETSAMSQVGGWEMNLETNSIYWSEQTKKLHAVGMNFVPDFDNAVQFYCKESQPILLEHISRLIENGEPFDLELELVTATSERIWVRTIGKPVYLQNKMIKIRGVIQNINDQKLRELELSSALHIINGQNDKLKDFAYIVSHNLRSHAGNLQMITEMVELETELDVKLEWIGQIKNVSSSLSETINNLNGLINLNSEHKKRLSFTQTFDNIRKALHYNLLNEDVQLSSDFSACEFVDHVPAYLESIMLNLITNAIKYKHPERNAVIRLQTALVNNKACLKITDNGLGIDLERYGNRLFKMSQTFHQNSNARGIGLYITKNQVEHMGGSIEVNSEVNTGTTFTIYF